MKKVIISLACIAIIALFAMPFITGMIAEKATQDIVNTTNERSVEFGHTEIVSYERGYKTTQSSFKWSYPGALQEGDNFVGYSCIGNHGVLNYSYNCKIDNLEEYTTFVNDSLNGKDPLSLTGKVTLWGSIKQRLELEEFQFTDDSNVVSVKPAYINFDTNKELSDFIISGKLNGMDVKGGSDAFTLGQSEIKGDISLNEQGIGIGEIEFAVSSLNGLIKDQSTIELNDLLVVGQTQEKGENLDMDYQIKVENIITKLTDGETDIDLKKLNFAMSMHGVDTLKVAAINQKMSDFYNDILSNQSAEPSTEQLGSLMAIVPDLEALLKSGLQLKTSLSADVSKEPASAEFDIALIDNMTMAEFMLAFSNPESLLDKMSANLKTSIPDSILSKQVLLKEAVINSPFYEQNGTSYQTDIKLAKDDVMLNGEKINANEFIALIMQQAQ